MNRRGFLGGLIKLGAAAAIAAHMHLSDLAPVPEEVAEVNPREMFAVTESWIFQPGQHLNVGAEVMKIVSVDTEQGEITIERCRVSVEDVPFRLIDVNNSWCVEKASAPEG